MGILYSAIDGVLPCAVNEGVFSYSTVGGWSTATQEIPIEGNLQSRRTNSEWLMYEMILAEAEDTERLFTLYRSSRWNLINKEDNRLLSYGKLEPLPSRPAVMFVGVIYLGKTPCGVFLDVQHDVAYISDNAYTRHTKKFKPGPLASLRQIDEQYCLYLASNDRGIAYCGSRQRIIMYDWKTGGFGGK